jgi:type VI secretion system protein ImpM
VGNRVTAGFWGKLPARGDFVRAGLPASFVEPLDAWAQNMIVTTRLELGSAWVSAWLEAPTWRFALPPGACGPDAALGVWIASADRVGRHFPLVLAKVGRGMPLAELAAHEPGFFAVAEQAGLDAIAKDLACEDLATRLTEVNSREAAAPLEVPSGGAVWWTVATDLRPAQALYLQGLPGAPHCLHMLGVAGTLGSP